MRRFAAAVVLVTVVVLGATSPVDAHNQDDNSLWACAATRPTASYQVDHSWWTYLYPGVAEGRCMVHHTSTGAQVCYLVSWYVDEGRFLGYSYDYSPPCWFDPHET